MAGEQEETVPSIYIMHFGEEVKGGVEEAIGYLITHSKLHFTKDARPKKVFPGSIILFTAKGVLFGEAIATSGIEETSQEDLRWLKEKYGREYELVVNLDKDSIRIYPKRIPIREVERIIGKRRARVFTRIDNPTLYIRLLNYIYGQR